MKNKFICFLAPFMLFIGFNLSSCKLEKKDMMETMCKTVTKILCPEEIDKGEVITSYEFRDDMVVYNLDLDETLSELRIDTMNAHLEETIEECRLSISYTMSIDKDIKRTIVNLKKIKAGIAFNYKSLQTGKTAFLPIVYDKMPDEKLYEEYIEAIQNEENYIDYDIPEGISHEAFQEETQDQESNTGYENMTYEKVYEYFQK